MTLYVKTLRRKILCLHISLPRLPDNAEYEMDVCRVADQGGGVKANYPRIHQIRDADLNKKPSSSTLLGFEMK